MALSWRRVTRAIPELNGLWTTMVATESGDQLLRKVTIFHEVDKGLWRRSQEEHRLRLWPVASVMERLRASGFQVEELPGYNGATMPPSLHVYLATKPG